nr:histidine kinase [Cellulosimicrobium arenosum]
MARELHDVAAHHLSGIVVQAAAAERLVDRDPERAKESMRRIRSQGRETLDNLRLVVGLLRGPGDTEAAPQPTLADVPGLLADARAAGADVQDQTRGDPCALAPSTQLTVYRVLQEALSNARRHGTGRRVEVLLDYREPGLVLHVRNAAPAAERGPVPGPASHGIVGMTERATMVGGTLTAGPRPDGAWYVRLAVPRSPRAVHHATGGTVLPAAPEEPGVAPSPTTEERP